MKKRILIIDNDAEIYTDAMGILHSGRYEVSFIKPDEVLPPNIKEFDLIAACMKPSSSKIWEKLRRCTDAPILIITKAGTAEEILFELSLGADDYIFKPFEPIDLCDRIENLFIKGRSFVARNPKESLYEIRVGQMGIRPEAREVQVGEHSINFSPKEFALLCFLASQPNKVFTRMEILQEVWGDYAGSIRTVDTHVKEIRRKFAEACFQDASIVTVWCTGYKFQVDEGLGMGDSH